MRATYEAAVGIVVAGALLRVVGVIVGAFRSFHARRRFIEFRVGVTECLTWLEPPLLAAVTLVLAGDHVGRPRTTALEVSVALVGAVIVAYGVNLLLWTVKSWRELFVGHGVLGGQQLLSSGAYGFVRHPAYLGCLLVWSGLSLTFTSALAALLTAVFVLPIYLAYIRTEEEMMEAHFGEDYRRYRAAVPMLVPGRRRTRHHPTTA